MSEGLGWTASLLAAAAVHAVVVGGASLLAPPTAGVAPRVVATVEVSLAPAAAEAAPAPAPAATAAAPRAEPAAPAAPPAAAPPQAAAAASAAEPAAAGTQPQAVAAAPVVAVAAVAAAAGSPAAFSRPRTLRAPAPAYPAGARRRGEQGTVTCLVRVAADGRVEHTSVSASSGWRFLDGAAIEAIEQTPFAPARAGERPVAGELVIKVRFDLIGVSVEMAAPR